MKTKLSSVGTKRFADLPVGAYYTHNLAPAPSVFRKLEDSKNAPTSISVESGRFATTGNASEVFELEPVGPVEMRLK